MTYSYQNPIIPGFHPDPSICRCGDDFYLVNSTFEFFPGVPVYHSRNLVNWELINHCLTRDSQLPLEGSIASGGIYAPTIRYFDGTFYMVTTNVTHRGHILVKTKDIRGQWSEPVYIDQNGIDPSLLFADGKVYFCSTGEYEEGSGLYLCEIDADTGEKLTPSRFLSRGAGGKFPEGPHIYKIKGMYYLMLAEGGTEYGHMVTMFRSREVYGPYEACPHNPILTQRNTMGPLQASGHADIVEDSRGHWWLVCLGIRTTRYNMLHHLGRETFLAPLAWDENGWPIAGIKGTLALTMEADLPGVPEPVKHDFTDDFTSVELKKQWTFIRNPERENYCLNPEAGVIRLTGTEKELSSPNTSPTFMGIRQAAFDMEADTILEGDFREGQKSGITAFYNDCYHYELYLTREKEDYYICLNKKVHDLEAVVHKEKIAYKGSIYLRITADQRDYRFSYSTGGAEYKEAGLGSTAGLSTEGTRNMTFTGTFIGLFSMGGSADFKNFKLIYEKDGK